MLIHVDKLYHHKDLLAITISIRLVPKDFIVIYTVHEEWF